MHVLSRILLLVALCIAWWQIEQSWTAPLLHAQSGQIHIVTSPANDGPGTLRQSLLQAQAGDTIRFDPTIFPPTAPITIALQTPLPKITVNRLTLDASDAGVILSGRLLVFVGDGLVIEGTDGVVIQGLQISHFPGDGLVLQEGARNTLIGGDRTSGAGPQGQGNVISGNRGDGVWLDGLTTTNNRLVGNVIGLLADGVQSLPNGDDGVGLTNGVQNTTIERNVISANLDGGIVVSGNRPISGVQISGNTIGLTIDRNVARSNRGDGIYVGEVAANIKIGGADPAMGNAVSGNGRYGIMVSGAQQVEILFNLIGLNGAGSQAISNGSSGLLIGFGGQAVTVQHNRISGNRKDGITIQDEETRNIVLRNNYIGVDGSGTSPVPNQEDGIFVSGAKEIVIGGATGQGNLISGNGGDGIAIQEPTAQVQVGDNYVGTDFTGSKAIGNQRWGIRLHMTKGQQIGVNPNAPLALRGNLISGNGTGGIRMDGVTTTVVAGNLIGVTILATAKLGNLGPGLLLGIHSLNNQIGGGGVCQQLRVDLCNVISGNNRVGLWVDTQQSNANNQIIGNLIGVGVGGLGGIGNLGDGIVVERTSHNRLQGNRVQNNTGIALRLSLGNLLQENDFSFNRYNYAQVVGGLLPTTTEVWQRQGGLTTYLVTQENLTIPGGAELRLDGVDVRFDFGRSLVVNGKLTATGSATEPVRLSSAGALVAPLPGDWQGVTIQPSGEAHLTYTAIELAQTGILLKGGALTMAESSILASQQDGIRLEAGNLQLVGNNALAGNGGMALCNQSGGVIIADNVWWGAAQLPARGNDCNASNNAVSAQQVQITQVITDPRPRNSWQTAPVLAAGQHSFTLTGSRDVQWFRIPVSARNATLRAFLANPPHDYDIFLFSDLSSDALYPLDIARVQNIDPDNPEEIARVQNIPGQIANIEGCSPDYLGQLNDVGRAENTARLVQASCRTGEVSEAVQYNVKDQSGWYYLLVAGHNGAHDASQPYNLTIAGEINNATRPINQSELTFPLPDNVSPNVRTLILTHQMRLEQHYPGQAQTVLTQLQALAVLTDVNGVVIDLATVSALTAGYAQWDGNRQGVDGVVSANLVAGQIKAYVTALRVAYPELKNIVIIGGDEIIPFYRVPDEVVIANERDYSAGANPDTALAAALTNGYFFTDNFYGSFRPLPWRGRELYLPDVGLGRLVESPAEIISAINAFIQQPTIDTQQGLCFGYDFMKDAATAYHNTFLHYLQTVLSFISDDWTVETLRQHWLNGNSKLVCLNAHFTHNYAVPAANAAVLSVEEVANADRQKLVGTLVFSIGCHSGLSVADGQSRRPRDFAQVLLGKGVTYIANTGFGYGDANAIGYSERLMALFVEWLPRTNSVGEALRQARLAYYNELGSRSLTPYDEKVLSVATFYGLPMLQMNFPRSNTVTPAETNASMWNLGEPTACAGQPSLTCRRATFTPVYELGSTGAYDRVQGEEPQLLHGQPVLPRASVAITLPQTLARGALFTGGRYTAQDNFDPAITQIVTDTTRGLGPEPAYIDTTWWPASWSLINSLRTPQGRLQRLVVTPAQYQATTPQRGKWRRFTEMQYTLFYTTTRDTLPPAIWQITDAVTADGANRAITVETSDFSLVSQVVVAYTLGDGEWKSLNLTPTSGERWEGLVDNAPTLEYFVQAVDMGGNVAVHDNKGQYFPVRARAPITHPLFLPLVRK